MTDVQAAMITAVLVLEGLGTFSDASRSRTLGARGLVEPIVQLGETQVCFWSQEEASERSGTHRGEGQAEPRVLDGDFCAFSADGKTLAAGRGSSLVLYEAATGKELLRVEGPPETRAQAAVFSPDGKVLAAGWRGDPGSIWLISPGNGKRLCQLADCSWDGRPFAFSPDGRLLAGKTSRMDAPSHGRGIHFWDTTTGERLRGLGLDKDLGDFSFSSDSRFITTEIYTWLNYEQMMRTRNPCISEFRFRIEAIIWDVSTGKQLGRIGDAREQRGPGGEGQMIHELGADTGRYRIRQAPDGSMCIFPQCQRVSAKVSPDSTIRVVDVAQEKERGCFRWLPDCTLTSLDLSPDRRMLAAVCHPRRGGAGKVLLWNVPDMGSQVSPQAGKSAPEQWEALWDKLASADPSVGYRVMCILAVSPGADSFLKGRVAPWLEPGEHRVGELITALDDDRFAVREKAERELLRYGEEVLPELRARLGDAELPPEARWRLERIVEGLKSQGTPSRDAIRKLRVVELLEQLGTREARGFLTLLAAGSPDAWLTREARASLLRLAARSGPHP